MLEAELASFGIRPVDSQLSFGFYGVRKRGSNSFQCIITRRRLGAAYLNGLAISCSNTIAQVIPFDACCTTTLLHHTDSVTCIWLLAFPELVSQRNPFFTDTFLLAPSVNLPWQKLERRHGRRAPSSTTRRLAHIIVPGRQVFGRYVFVECDRPRAL